MAEIDVTRIAGNIGAMNSLNSLANINKKLAIHQTRLATGKRINSAADDPAGLTIGTKMLSRSEGLKTALNNIGDAKNLLAVAESGMGRINDILVQMRNSAEAGASDTMGVNERSALVTQMTAYAQQIDDIVNQTKWNGKALLDGSINGGATALRFQTGAEEGDATKLESIVNLSGSATNGTGPSLGLVRDAELTAAGGSVDSSGILSSPASGVATNANLSTLTAGDYRVEVTYAGTDGTQSTVRLFSASDNYTDPLLIDADETADGAVHTEKEVILTADKLVDFGNGLSVTIDAYTGDDVVEQTITGFIPTGSTTTGLQLSNTTNDADGILTKDSSAAAFAQYMSDIEKNLDTVSGELSKLGSLTGRLTFKEDQISAAQINTEAAYNRVMNANMAEEQVNASKYQILQQTATAMLAQANAAPQFLLSLFR